MRDTVLRAVATVVGEANATARASDLAAAGVDPTAWPENSRGAVLARPASAAEVAELVKVASERGLAIVPVGSGTRATPAMADVPTLLLDLARLNHVINLDETSLLVHVQAGLTALELEEILAPRGLSLGDFPPMSLASSIGGLLAVRTPGKTSTRHGFMEDAVLGVSAVLADGRTIHTRIAPRRATGPDLARAVCGSEGTIGIITSAVLRIHRLPEARFLAAFSLPSFGDALAAVRLSLREEAAPAAMRAYDCAEARASFGNEVCADSEALLTIATAGPTDLAACDRELVASAVTAVGGERREDDLAETWWAERTGNSKREPPHIQVSATPSKQLAVYEAARAAAKDAGIAIRARASRFDQRGGVLFFTLTDADGGQLDDQVVALRREAVEIAAGAAGAYLLGAWNPKLAPYFAELRRVLDPSGMFNPGVG